MKSVEGRKKNFADKLPSDQVSDFMKTWSRGIGTRSDWKVKKKKGGEHWIHLGH